MTDKPKPKLTPQMLRDCIQILREQEHFEQSMGWVPYYCLDPETGETWVEYRKPEGE